MKKVLLLLLLMVSIPAVMQAQDDDTGVSLGLNAGYDYDFNAFRLNSNGTDYASIGSFYAINSHWNLGGDVGVRITKRLRPRFELKFVKMSYGFNWSKDYPSWNKTEVKLYNLDMNFRLDYLLLNTPKFQIYASPALKTEFVTSSYYKTTKTNGDTEDLQPSVLKSEYPKSIAGAALSMIFKYNLNESFGLTFTPEYTHFFRNYIRGNGKPFERLSTNLGIEYKF